MAGRGRMISINVIFYRFLFEGMSYAPFVLIAGMYKRKYLIGLVVSAAAPEITGLFSFAI